MQNLPFNPILLWAKDRIKKNKNLIIIINGATGSGKTYSGLRLALDLSKELGTPFSVKGNVGFKFSELLKKSLLPENTKPGTVFLFEEVGSTGGGASSREWQSNRNKFFFSFMQTSRHRNQILIFTCPQFAYLEKGTRELCHMQMSMISINHRTKVSVAKPFILQTNPQTGKIYFKFLRLKYKGLRHKLTRLQFKIPPKDLLEPYEKMKLEYTTQLSNEIIASEEQHQNHKEIDKDKMFIQLDEGLKTNYLMKCWNVSERTIQRYRKEWKTDRNRQKSA